MSRTRAESNGNSRPTECIGHGDDELESFFAHGSRGVKHRSSCRALRAALRTTADLWPEDELREYPRSLIDEDGPWGARACGVVVKPCKDHPSKGNGVFATQRLRAGSVIGVYMGEVLSPKAFQQRHNRFQGCLAAVLRLCPRCIDRERYDRLSILKPGRAPIGGFGNGGSYVVCLAERRLVEWSAKEQPDRPMYIDAEDADRSSWCRYINHADGSDGDRCNCELRVAAEPQPRAWLVARREIQPGEEVQFDYGPRYNMPRSELYASHQLNCCGLVCILGVH